MLQHMKQFLFQTESIEFASAYESIFLKYYKKIQFFLYNNNI